MSAFDIIHRHWPVNPARAQKDDPPPRDDGRCARAGCSRPVKPQRRKDVPLELYAREPFCSTECAKEFHT